MMQAAALLMALGTIVVLIKNKRPLYQAMLAGILIILLSLGQAPGEIFLLLGRALSSRATLELVFAVGLISLLSRMLKDMGFLDKLMHSMLSLLNSAKAALVIIPALIGLFPVVGGAIMSAPLVDVLGGRLKLSREVKTSANLIFRHAVFFFSPFNPALILIASITGFSLLELIKRLSLLGIVNFTAGYLVYLQKAREKPVHHPLEAVEAAASKAPGLSQPATLKSSRLHELKALLRYGSPLFLSLALFIAAGVPLILSLLAGILIAFLLGEKKEVDFKALFLHGPNPLLMLGIAGIMVFQYLVVNMEGLFIIMEHLSRLAIPPFFLFTSIPLLVGWISASFSLAVGVIIPLLFPLLQKGGSAIYYVVLLYASAYFSYFISPIHICQVLSNSYFEVKAFEAYRVQFVVLFTTFLAGIILFWAGINLM